MNDGFIFPTWLMIVLGALVALAVLAVLFVFLKDVLTALFSKTITTNATLISKYEQNFVTQKVYAAGGAGNAGVASGVAEKGKEYFFTFKCDNGKYITLLVPKDAYDVAKEEGNGMLTYKGKRFISYDGPTEGTRIRTEANTSNFVGLNKDL